MLFLCGYGLFVSGYIAGGSSVPLYIGAGNQSNYTDTQGQVWLSDRSYTGGTAGSTTASIANTADPTLFQNYRTATSGSFSYTETVSSGGRFRVTELENEPITSNMLGSRIQTIALSCDSNLVTQHPNFDILDPSGSCGGATTANRACFVNDWIRCGSPGDGQSHTITIAFSPLTGQPITSGIAIVPSPQTAMVAVPTPVPTPGGYPVIGQCVAGLGPANGAAIPLTATLNSGQSMVLFHKGTNNNPGEFDSYPGQGSISDIWTEAAGAAANSSNCVQASYVINPVSTGSVTVTANSPGSGANNFAVLCTVSGAVMVDLASGQAYPGQAASSNAVTGNVNTFSARDTLLGMIYDEATSPTLSGNWLHNVGLGIINDLTPSVAGTSSNTTQLLALASETDTANNSTYGFQHGLGQAGTGQCGGMIGISSSLIAANTVTPTCSPSTIGIGATSNCTASAALVNGTSQNVSSNTTWASSNANVASVNPTTGVVTGVALGTATIMSTYNGVSGQTTVAVATQTASTTVNDEFNGPFATWITATNPVGTGCAAMVSGTDSTTQFQCLVSYLSSHATTTLYLPQGTYNISGSISFPSGTGNRIIGHSPVDTTVNWTGGAGQNLFNNVTGLNEVDFERITFNGNNTLNAFILYGQGAASENQIFKDCVFENMAYAWYSVQNGQDSEMIWFRCVFKHITQAGQYTNAAFNLLDYWFWYCTFIDCNIGIDWNVSGGGVFYSVFLHPTTPGVVDIVEGTNQPSVFRGNVSSGANQFYSAGSGCGNSTKTSIFHGNIILNPVQATAIAANNCATDLYLDNQILNSAGNTSPPISQTGGWGAVMIGNQYTIPAINGSWIAQSGGFRLVEVTNDATSTNNDRQVAPSTISQACPNIITGTVAGTPTYWDGTTGAQNLAAGECYPVPPAMTRQCYFGGGSHAACGPTNADEGNPVANIQGDINQACIDSANGGGTRPVIHIPAGSYTISSTINIPANCDVQIEGEGRQNGNTSPSVFQWGGAANQPAFLVHAHSRARFASMGTQAAGIQINTEDVNTPATSRVQAWNSWWGPNYSQSLPANSVDIETNGLANTYINIYNAFLQSDATDVGSTVMTAIGNGIAGAQSRIAAFLADFGSLQTNSSGGTLSVSLQGNMLIEGGYQDSFSNYLLVQNSSNSGTITLTGFRWAGNTPTTQACFINLNGFTGTATLSDLAFSGGGSAFCTGQICTSNIANTNFLISGTAHMDPNPMAPLTTSATVGAIQNTNPVPGTCGGAYTQELLADSSPAITQSQIIKQFAQLRNTAPPTPNYVLPAGVTDVQFDEVFIHHAQTGLVVQPGT